IAETTAGLDHGLTNYGDRDFSRYLRRSFAQSMGYSRAMLDKPVVGIAYTGSDFNNCHRHFPELLAAVNRGERLGACTDCRRFWARYRSGEVDADEISEVEGQLAVTAGTCAVMGTASTMACLTEALGICLPGTAAIPAVHADRLRAAEATGAAAVKLIGSKLKPSQLIIAKSVENALRVLLALGGSTNAVIHLTAIAGRAGIKISLDHLNTLSDSTPVLVNLKPVGNGYMEDFCAAGGMGALLRELKPLLHLDCMTVTGETLGERLEGDAESYVDRPIIAEAKKPLEPTGGLGG